MSAFVSFFTQWRLITVRIRGYSLYVSDSEMGSLMMVLGELSKSEFHILILISSQ